MLRPFLILSLFLAACGDNRTPVSAGQCGYGLTPYAGEPDTFDTFPIWVQDDPDLSTVTALESCDMWLPEGIQCSPLPIAGLGRVRVYAKHDPCLPDKDGGYVLATAYGGGEIDVQIECMRDWFLPEEDGTISRQALKLVLGHEIGHETGIWFHVPASCDEGAAAGDFEKELVREGVCGAAMMNAVIDTNVCFMTDLDASAYDRRDRSASAFPHLAADAPPDCVLTYRPAP